VVLALTLNGRAAFEERLLPRHWPGYPAYLAHTRRFLPGL
jgi:protein-S-isoprenylcysteine O-methyltransferase Ste14